MQDRKLRKHRVLSHGLPSVTRTIADAIVLKQGDLFLIAGPDGQVPHTSAHGLGLYYHDCRFLRTYEVRLNGASPVPLGVTVAEGDRGTVQLTNPELTGGRGRGLPRDTLDIEWNRSLDGEALALTEVLTLRNWGHREIEFQLQLRFDAGFEDVFDVRGLLDEQLGTQEPLEWKDGVLRFVYHGRDDLARSLTVLAPPDLRAERAATLVAGIRLAPREERRLPVQLLVREAARDAGVRPTRREAPASSARAPEPSEAAPGTRGDTCTSDSRVLDGVLERSLQDLRLLRSSLDGHEFLAAGIPWFATLFGRDSLIAGLQLLPFTPAIARDTLRLLAAYQADRVDEWRDAEPGKILHELRVGEMSRSGAIPHSPYYGTVDATPLFLIVLERYVAWTGDIGLFDELRDHVGRALEWIARYGDADGDGYVEYRSTSEDGLVNQGWKDSGDAIVDQAGLIATPPISMVEVQAYVYAAKLAVAALCERRAERDTAARLRAEAIELQRKVEDEFWIESLGCYAMALEAAKQPLRVVSSNAGHVLWCGLARPERAARVAERLMASDMFSGWGVRTLSEQAAAYNPIGYHLGTVWPHDNAFIAAGFKRYGLSAPAIRIFDGIADAATTFEHQRLPELWTGFSREQYGAPIRYPVACHPQAWAAGSLPFLLTRLLGLEPAALDRTLRIVRPVLPGLAHRLELRVEVAGVPVHLRFERVDAAGAARVEVLAGGDRLDIRVEEQA